jgi:hypothetical protein
MVMIVPAAVCSSIAKPSKPRTNCPPAPLSCVTAISSFQPLREEGEKAENPHAKNDGVDEEADLHPPQKQGFLVLLATMQPACNRLFRELTHCYKNECEASLWALEEFGSLTHRPLVRFRRHDYGSCRPAARERMLIAFRHGLRLWARHAFLRSPLRSAP